jgi:MSHA biogenesis protein MshI
VENQGADSLQAFAERLIALGLGGWDATFMLRPEQCQLLQLAAPAVTPEELRSAVRYQIREMVSVHIDDLTIDVLNVGDGQEKSAGQLFVVTTENTVIRDAMALADVMRWNVSVIDIQEMAHRNLQSALASVNALPDRATAALVVVSERQALLTISAKGELYYSRRLDLPEGFLAMEWSAGIEFFEDNVDAYEPVVEYVPGYDTSYVPGGAAASGSDTDRAERFLVEVQRSLDLWDRTWTSLPLAGLRVYAGERSFDLSAWLSQEMGQTVTTFEVEGLFKGADSALPEDRMTCLPLLGILLRTENRTS